MGETITALFTTRRDADLAVEHLVQDHGVVRTDVFIEADSPDNSAGTEAAGADVESGHPRVETDAAPALAGMIKVSVDLQDMALAGTVRDVLAETGTLA